jgi:hypothetical protein
MISVMVAAQKIVHNIMRLDDISLSKLVLDLQNNICPG